MALNLLIPRIEWNELSLTGDTHTSTLIDDIADVSEIKVGMIVTGSGVQTGTAVQSIGANSVVLTLPTTTTLGNTPITMFERFDFDYPPVTDSDEDLAPNRKETRSLTGESQVQHNYLEWQRDVTFDFLTETQKDTLKEDFLQDWAIYGNEFRYFYDKADSAYVEYSLRTANPKFKRTVKKHPYFLYQTKFQFKRVE